MKVLKEVKKNLTDGWSLCFQMVKSYKIAGARGYRFIWQKDNKEMSDVDFKFSEPKVLKYIKELQFLAKQEKWFGGKNLVGV